MGNNVEIILNETGEMAEVVLVADCGENTHDREVGMFLLNKEVGDWSFHQYELERPLLLCELVAICNAMKSMVSDTIKPPF